MSEPSQEGTGVRARYSRWRATSRGRKTLKAAYAQAAREKQARIILGEAELAIAHSFAEAAQSYHNNPTALHLRAMNMLYEGLKEKGALMLVPSSALDSMGMGGLMGAAALRQNTLTDTTRVLRIGLTHSKVS